MLSRRYLTLKKAKFTNIKYINFACDKINDNNIEVLSNLHFKYLEELNLFGNYFRNYDFFSFTNDNESYKNLKTLYLGQNNFEIKGNSQIEEHKLLFLKKI